MSQRHALNVEAIDNSDGLIVGAVRPHFQELHERRKARNKRKAARKAVRT